MLLLVLSRLLLVHGGLVSDLTSSKTVPKLAPLTK